ncbi:MAG: HEAT repeat domain-containing protein, partial [Planctomycetota bacterium]
MTRTRWMMAAGLARLLAGCASDPAGTPPNGGSTGGGDSSTEAPRGGETGTDDSGDSDRALVYDRITSMSNRWAALGAEPGVAAQSERSALASAIGGEVARDIEAVLAEARSGENPRFRRAAVRGLGFVATRQDEILQVLQSSLGSSDVRLVTDVLVSMARHAHRDTDVELVAARMQHPDPVVRSNAALCLARVFRTRRSVGLEAVDADLNDSMEAVLMTALFDPQDPFVRGHASQALGALGSAGAEGALLNGLRDQDTFARLSAAVALGSVGTRQSATPLIDALGRATDDNEKDALALSLG